MTETRTPELLDGCPVCGYLLEGLPVEHRCPECGFAFDRRWAVFGGRGVRKSAARVVRGVLLSLIVPIAVLGAAAIMWPGETLVALLISGAIVALALLFIFRSSQFWVAVTPTGVRLYEREAMVREVAWGTFHSAWAGMSGDLVLRSEMLDEHLCGIAVFGGSREELERCIEGINTSAFNPAPYRRTIPPAERATGG